MAEVPVSMRGKIVGTTPDGEWIADMHRPAKIAGVRLPLGALCTTRVHPAHPDARVRVTSHHGPDLPVQEGDSVAALVGLDHTGSIIQNSLEPVAEPVVISATAERWGVYA
jgi:hypothetical protein